MLIQMGIAGLIFEDDEKSFYLLLKERKGSTIVSIQIDQLQAESIAVAMDSNLTRIPDPYNFIGNVMDSFQLKISKIIIKNRKRYTKNTEVFLTDGDREIRIDSHAGDAIASALFFDTPIFIDSNFPGTGHKKELKKWLSEVRPSDFGK